MFADRLGILRLVHFLALAAICLRLAGPGGVGLRRPGLAPLTAVLETVGRQSLAVFLAGMVLAQALGLALDHAGRGLAATALANLTGFAVLVAVALTVGWFKSVPWKEKRP